MVSKHPTSLNHLKDNTASAPAFFRFFYSKLYNKGVGDALEGDGWAVKWAVLAAAVYSSESSFGMDFEVEAGFFRIGEEPDCI